MTTLNYTINENSWAIVVDEDVNQLTESQAVEITDLLKSNKVLIFKNQQMTADQEVFVAKKIGDPIFIYDPSKPLKGQYSEYIAVNEHIVRITGKKNAEGRIIGSAGQKGTFDWHIDRITDRHYPPIYWLYAVEESKGSCTSFLSLTRAYDALDSDLKERIKDKKVICGIKEKISVSWLPEGLNTFYPEEIEYDLVQSTSEGLTRLFLPVNQVYRIENEQGEEQADLLDMLKSHVLQEKFIHHHYWDDGDLVLANHRLTLHKRWAFDKMDKRVMHRLIIDFK